MAKSNEMLQFQPNMKMCEFKGMMTDLTMANLTIISKSKFKWGLELSYLQKVRIEHHAPRHSSILQSNHHHSLTSNINQCKMILVQTWKHHKSQQKLMSTFTTMKHKNMTKTHRDKFSNIPKSKPLLEPTHRKSREDPNTQSRHPTRWQLGNKRKTS